MRKRGFDGFCGAGGCTKGYQRVGFEMWGCDLNPQPNYCGERFIQEDALELLADLDFMADFDFVHASPPCQAYSQATAYHGTQNNHPDLVEPTRELLEATRLPWVMENVPGSPVAKHVLLCGEMFGLRLHRHRYFETGGGFHCMQPLHQAHHLKGALHNCDLRDGHARLVAGNYADHESASEAMGIDWMTRNELRQAIPPEYTELIGHQLMQHVKTRAAA